MSIATVLLAIAADEAFGDPRRGHPVAGYGRAVGRWERAVYRPRRGAGVVFTVGAVGPVTALAAASGWFALRVGGPAALAMAASVGWATIGGRSLRRIATAVGDLVEADDLAGARELIPSLCGRDPNSLDGPAMVRAALESLAENTSDAAVGPLVCGAIAGPAGFIGYRAINTLDSMVGYRNEMYREFGWASARLDDLINLGPARVAGIWTVLLAPTVGGSASGALRAWREDAAGHPSPNAGVVEASMAGALGVRLGGETRYPHGIEMRPILGDGRAPIAADITRAARLSLRVEVASALSAAAAVTVGKAIFAASRRRRVGTRG